MGIYQMGTKAETWGNGGCCLLGLPAIPSLPPGKLDLKVRIVELAMKWTFLFTPHDGTKFPFQASYLRLRE